MKPILFSTPMLRAILEGSKTQTRRVVKCFPGSETHPIHKNPQWHFENKTCPYGKTGDVLWVRESFFDSDPFYTAPLFEGGPRYYYKADGDNIGCHKWKPSIHMPYAACRIFLKVENVRVEWLHDIIEPDAKAEGVEWTARQGYKNYLSPKPADQLHFAKTSFQTLWKSINGTESWDANPLVWVIEFSKIRKPKSEPHRPLFPHHEIEIL